jgi:hypothetical protein
MAAPAALLVALATWHFCSCLALEPLGSVAQHVGLIALALAMGLAALFYRDRAGDGARYVEGLISPYRGRLVGGACLILGGLHFVSLPGEGVFLKMGYLTLALACFEAAGIAELFLPAMRGEPAPATLGTLRRTALRQAGMLVAVFLLSVVLLYMSLMIVVGSRTRGPWDCSQP